MNGPDLDVLYAAAEADERASVDSLMQRRFGCEPVEDLSGMFTGSPSLVPAPTAEPEPSAPTLPTIHQGPRTPAAVDDGAMVDAYMRSYFPGSFAKPTWEGGST